MPEIIAQIVGYKNLKIAGGMRLELDLFEGLPEDICQMVLLANAKMTVKINVEPIEQEKPTKKKKAGKSTKEFKEGELP